MSMFRKPGEDSSSSSESSSEHEDDRSIPQQDSVLSRINTLESASSERAPVERPLRPNIRQTSDQNVRDLLLHALMEKDALREAADHLGRDRSDPDVQTLAKEVYQRMARQISSNVDDTYAKPEMQSHRAAAQEGIEKLTKKALNSLAMIPENGAQALMLPNAYTLNMQPSTGLGVMSGIGATAGPQLRGYPGVQTDRYHREFDELCVVGKGGFGKVYKARHKLDGTLYAVKRIPISEAKVARIQEHGPKELESMLEEVRSLARFEHSNIVRYHNAWLEFSTTATAATAPRQTKVVRKDRLLEFASDSTDTGALQRKFGNLNFREAMLTTDRSDDAGIVFEDSAPGGTESKDDSDAISLREKLKISKRKIRRGSQATIATISSTKSHLSAVEDVDEDEDGDEEEEVEFIPRSNMAYMQDSTTDASESMLSQSGYPGQLMSTTSTGPLLMLNVQMSLCDTNLASFLSCDQHTSDLPARLHCFHPCVSLELLGSIVSGVQYLHAQGVVHRDLKPANIFLSFTTQKFPPYGSVDISSCTSCTKQERLHVTPRIGDFGLVTALDNDCLDMDIGAKPVGTEFYRPQMSKGNSEKLDVYALGVVAFEMLQNFTTRMERIETLKKLGGGAFPAGFARSLGDLGKQVQELIENMMEPDETKRIGCAEAKTELGKLVHIMKA